MNTAVFPVGEILPEILQSLAAHPRLVLEAPPGAGKTTQVPLALLDAPWLSGQKILMLEPRRVAARAAAMFMAQQLGEAVGETVGYRIRFEKKVSARTRIEVVTEGILTRLIQDDPLLDGVGAILFDEFHERHLASDLGLALALDVQASVRDTLRIVLMSATLDGERLGQWLDAPRISSAGRSFPVTVSHFPARRDESPEVQLKRAVEAALAQHPGDVLVFLPGLREIRRAQAMLETQPLTEVEILSLHGELPVEQQARVLQPAPVGKRRVVLATNVAESSLTLPGVRVVIDTGLAREPRYDPNSGFSRLEVQRIAQASADQRAGRAGRVAAGHCYRLWPESERLAPQRRAEIQQVELAGLALELAAWGSDALRFVDAPPAGALAAARDLLRQLGALDEGQAITAHGRALLALGTHPRLATMLLAAQSDQDRALACDLAALMEARDPLRSRSDALAERWQALAAFRRGQTLADASGSALAAIDHAAKQWRRRIGLQSPPHAHVPAHALGDVLAQAFPDRIAHKQPGQMLRYQLSNGRRMRLHEESVLQGEPWLVASELRFESRDALLLRGVPVDENHLRTAFADDFREADEVRWDTEKRALVAERTHRFAGIVLASRPAGKVDPALATPALLAAVRELGLEILPWDAHDDLLARVACLKQWMPELSLPDFSAPALLATLADWLAPVLVGKTRLDAVQSHELHQALANRLDWESRRRIDQLAPSRITVPSGLARPIRYLPGDGDSHEAEAVLAVKLQELFGLGQTPRICDGRIPLTLHLLSPAQRPLQVTRDLKSFWENTYPEVKKEMKGRYPKHPWPDDPWNAVATHRAKPRGT
ncbi:ATP-dependent helicase HrpB [Lysobacteraceae bacterium NML08-0793]|nr:ATP-dependent helicase HrpB [Xanthomonadaceae bacterium NML08-0793]